MTDVNIDSKATQRMMHTPASINNWALQTFGPDKSLAIVAARANLEMAELVDAIAMGKSKEDIAEEASDVLIILYRLFNMCNTNVYDAVDRKMEINRKRKWKKANGIGHHTKVESNDII